MAPNRRLIGAERRRRYATRSGRTEGGPHPTLLADQGAVVERRMFGGIAFLINGNMAVAASGQGGLTLRCEPSEAEWLVAEPGADRW